MTVLNDSTAGKKVSVGCHFHLTVNTCSCLLVTIFKRVHCFFFPRQFLHELEACAKNPDNVPKVILRHVSENVCLLTLKEIFLHLKMNLSYLNYKGTSIIMQT